MERVAFYARVSTDEQVEGYSINAQLKALEEFTTRQGWEVVARYVDEGESARTVNRPEFQRMVSAAKQKPRPFDIILVHKFDRFARNREDSSVYKALFRRDCGIEVRSVSEQTDNSPSGKLLEGMLELVAEFYSNNLAHEVLKGQRERALAAKANGVPPIGYITDATGRYQPDPQTAHIVRWIYSEYACGNEGYRNLAHRLNAEGEERFGPAVRNYRWTDAFVRKILTNEAYCGTYIWGRRDSNQKYAERDRAQWVVIENAHEPLVTRELFDRAQSLRENRQGVRRADPGQDYLLRGLVRCLDCGAKAIKFRYQWDDRRTGQRIVQPCLICAAYSKGNGCYCNRVTMADVESAVIRYLGDILRGHINSDEIQVKFEKPAEYKKDLDMIGRRIAAVDKKLQRLVDAYTAEAISMDELKAGRERIMAERSVLEQQRADLTKSAEEKDPEELAAEVRSRVQAILEDATDEKQPIPQRRAALERILDTVSISRKRDLVKIVFRL